MCQYLFFLGKIFLGRFGQKRDFWSIFGLKRPKIRVLSYFLEIGWSKCSDFLHYDRKQWYLENDVIIFFIAYLIWPIMADFWPKNAKKWPENRVSYHFLKIGLWKLSNYLHNDRKPWYIENDVKIFFHEIFNLAHNGGFFARK